MKPIVKRVLKGVGGVIAVLAIGGGIFVKSKTSAFDDSMDLVYDVSLTQVPETTDAEVIARGKHVVEALGGCTSANCHGADLSGGKPLVMGPVCTLIGPNITPKGLGALYTKAEMVRLLRHGVKKDGRSVRFMPVQDFNWLPDSDLFAAVTYLKTVPSVDRQNDATEIKTLGKILDRNDKFVVDVARRIDHQKMDLAPPPTPTADYGKYMGRLCIGCHGAHLSGGPIPGAPKDLPVPLNMTPDDSGIKGWTYEDLDALLTKGLRKNGKQLNPFMPIENWSQMNETEKRALYTYLMSLPPLPFGGR